MRGRVISYFDMCQREGTSLQRGMNFQIGEGHSVVLMSVRPNAPYRDRIEEDGTVLIYEGHDVPTNWVDGSPKLVDQPSHSPNGTLTENGKFTKAVERFKTNKQKAELVQVYEKIRPGIWTDNGIFHLVDSWLEGDGTRNVFKFKLEATETVDISTSLEEQELENRSPGRLIPSSVKQEVWKRDGGKCQKCNATDELHFDHILPFSKGGTSLKADNIQLLCARHNLQKRDRIE